VDPGLARLSQPLSEPGRPRQPSPSSQPGLSGQPRPTRQPGASADVVIIGGGITGTAAAWALTQRGVRDVVVLERGTVASGGTGKSSGIVRCHYGVPALAAMAWKGLRLLENGGRAR
jgi:NADPH-dependent 2,4-dienoyl-CoA reductase/sulfur reductase-like enzyme